MKKRRFILSALSLLLLPVVSWASTFQGVQLQTPLVELDNHASLQRGAKTYITYCLACHSLKYVRYEQVAIGSGLPDGQEKQLQQLGLLPAGAKLTDPILSPMTADQAKTTFGVVPPDLSLEARVRGIAWIYTYLHSFYKDPSRPTGVNNVLFPDLAMPNVLEGFQGTQVPVYVPQEVDVDGGYEPVKVIEHLTLEKPGAMTPAQFDQMTTDLVNFLGYVAEPVKVERIRIGIWVLAFLVIFLILAFLLKKEYWKDVH